jgi:hypothetical protein
MDILSLFIGAIIGAFFSVLADLLFKQRIFRLILQIRRGLARVTRKPDPKDKNLEIANTLYLVDFLPDAILEFIIDHYPWTDNGLATLYYAMVREWGYWEIKSAFSRHFIPWKISE